MSRRALAERAGISQKQIQRLEDPAQASKSSVRSRTVQQLADALGVEVEKLAGHPPQVPGFKVTRISASLLPGVRLAYELIERRYGINAGHLINMAPLFFTLLAEGSLAWRQAELDELLEAIDQVRELGDGGRKRFALHAWHAESDSGLEQAALDRGDVFGDPYPQDYQFEVGFEDWDGRPFADYLRKLARDIDKPGRVKVDPDSAGESVIGMSGVPGYLVCSADLDEVVAPGSDASYALYVGDVRLSEIPEDLTTADARAAWLEGQLSAESREWLSERKKFDDLLDDVTTEGNENESE